MEAYEAIVAEVFRECEFLMKERTGPRCSESA